LSQDLDGVVELVVAEARVRDWYGVHGGHRRRAQVQRRQQRRGEEVAVEGAQKFLPRFHVVLDEAAQSGQVVQLVHCERWDGDRDRDGEVSAGMRSSGSTDGSRWTGRGRNYEWPPRRSFGNLNLSVRTRTSPGWVAVGASASGLDTIGVAVAHRRDPAWRMGT
jgi:hypothetical protein